MFFKKLENFLGDHSLSKLHGRHIRIRTTSPTTGKIELILKVTDVIANKESLIIQTVLGITIAACLPRSNRIFSDGQSTQHFQYVINPSFIPAMRKVIDSNKTVEEEIFFNGSFEVEVWRAKK